jgi:hypothetical protein
MSLGDRISVLLGRSGVGNRGAGRNGIHWAGQGRNGTRPSWSRTVDRLFASGGTGWPEMGTQLRGLYQSSSLPTFGCFALLPAILPHPECAGEVRKDKWKQFFHKHHLCAHVEPRTHVSERLDSLYSSGGLHITQCISCKTKKFATTRSAKDKGSSKAPKFRSLRSGGPCYISFTAVIPSMPGPCFQAAVADLSFPPVPARGQNLVPPKLCQNRRIHAQAIILLSSTPASIDFQPPAPGESLQHQLPGLQVPSLQAFPGGTAIPRDHLCISADPTIVSRCRISIKPSNK